MPSSQLPIDAEWLPMHADRSQYDKILSRDRDSGTCEVGVLIFMLVLCHRVPLLTTFTTTMFAVSDEECFLTILIAGLISMLTARNRQRSRMTRAGHGQWAPSSILLPVMIVYWLWYSIYMDNVRRDPDPLVHHHHHQGHHHKYNEHRC